MTMYNSTYRKFLVGTLLMGLTATHSTAAENTRYVPAPPQIQILSTGSFDGNRIENDLENNGMITSHRISGRAGMEWPRGNSSYTVYASGLWIAGMVNGEIRTAVAEYAPEMISGPYGSVGNEVDYRLYKMNANELSDPLFNPDFQNWPTSDGAPYVDSDGDGMYTPMPDGGDYPEILGDQMVWYVANDNIEANHMVFGTQPLGLEVQTSIWGYDRIDELGDMMYVKSLIINKGANEISDAFVGIWSDPDIGDAGDDFVGCDTLLGLGYAYNDGSDGQFGAAAPAVGYDFIQGPMVASVGDTAQAFGRRIAGFRNLEMTSFTKYINSDPYWTDPNDAVEAYNYMNGLDRAGSPFVNTATGEITKYAHPDDPNDNVDATDNIWVDGDDNPADDRRFLMNAGPFNLAPGDSQEVIYVVMMAQGSDALHSITRLKEVDESAQLLADNNFIPGPDMPVIDFANAHNPIVVADNLNGNGIANNGEMIKVSFSIENISQQTESFRVTIRPVSTSVIHEAGESLFVADLPPAPSIYNIPPGAEPLFYIPSNYAGSSLVLQIDINMIGSTQWNRSLLEIPVELLNHEPDPSVHWIENVEGVTDAQIGFRVTQPSELTGAAYEITFSDQYYDDQGVLTNGFGINLFNMNTATLLLDQHALPDEHQFNIPETEGFKVIVSGSSAGFHGVFLIQAGTVDRSFVNDDINYSILMEDVWTYGWGNDDLLAAITFPDDDPEVPNGRYWITQGGGEPSSNESYVARVLRNDNAYYALPNDFEVRWLDQTDESAWSWGIWYGIETEVAPVKVPFELWNIGNGTPDDASDDVRMIPRIYDFDANGRYNWQGDLEDSGGADDAHTDWVYWWSLVDGSTWTEFEAFCVAGDAGNADALRGYEFMARTVFMNHNGVGGHLATIDNSMLTDPSAANWTAADTTLFLENGFFLDPVNSNAGVTEGATEATGFVLPFPSNESVFRWITNKPVNTSLVATFNTEVSGLEDDGVPNEYALAKNFPNPFNPTTTLQYQLPREDHVSLIIFDVRGREIMKLVEGVKPQGGHTQIWDGHDAYGHPVSSGMYLYRMETSHFSKTMKMVYLK